MVKKCIVEHDELGNPINLIEVKEFTDAKSVKDFLELCKKNSEAMAQRQKLIKEEEEKKKAEARKAQDELVIKVSNLWLAVKHILGIEEVKNVEDLFKGEDDDEQKD